MNQVLIARSLLIAAAMLTPTTTLYAQAINPGNVPLELVQGLTQSFTGEQFAAPDVYVGRLPEQTERVLPLPRGSRIIGSFARTGYSMNLIEVAQPLEAARDALEASLIAAGWRKQELPGRGGFEATNVPHGYCLGDSMALNPRFSKDARGVVKLVAVHHSRAPYMPCRPEFNEMPYQASRLIPSLAAPAGAQVSSMGVGGGGEQQRADARITTELSVEQLTKHYGDQLLAAGWKPIKRVTSDVLAAENYRVTDEKGADWHGVLTVTTADAAADRLLSLHVTRAKR